MRNWSRGIARNLPHQLPLEIYNDAQLVCMKRGYILLQSKFWAFFINTSPTFAQNIGLSKENHVHTSKCIEDEQLYGKFLGSLLRSCVAQILT